MASDRLQRNRYQRALNERPTPATDKLLYMEKSKKLFNPQAILHNVNCVRGIIQRIRQREGGIGSVEDELVLYRSIQDLDLLMDMVNNLKTAYDDLQSRFDSVNTTREK